MNASSLYVMADVDTHGAIEDSRVGVVRRTLALWCIAAAQRLLKSRIDVSSRSR